MGRKEFAFCGNLLIFIMMMSVSIRTTGQTSMPEVLSKGTLKEQLDYINDKTRIYEEYRAIREDLFQKIKSNSIDSLNGAKAVIAGLKGNVRARDVKIDSLKASLVSVKGDLDQMTKTKDSISLLGIEINKVAYNALMWIIIAILAGALAIGFMVFKRNRIVTIHTKKDYEDLKKEFEAYRKASREAREKMSMTHFNELKKLRGA